MKNICFYFQVHQPFRLKRYHFFNIGKDSSYFDEMANAEILRKVAGNCYLPANQLLLELIHQYGNKFKVSFSISGAAIEQFEQYMPEVLDSFKALAQTGCVEFLSETYGHTLAILKSEAEFKAQVAAHTRKIQQYFGQTPTTFRNTELIYSDYIGSVVASMGYTAMLAEGADNVLNWQSPNYLYTSAANPDLKLLLKNFRLSDDIAFRFSNKEWYEFPLTADKFVNWINALPGRDELVNLFMDYETFGEHQWAETGIFDFLKALPGIVLFHPHLCFITPSEAANMLQPAGNISMPQPVSWADEQRDLSAWLGNEIQDDAFDTLYSLEPQVNACNDAQIKRDWLFLQTSDHFYYMCTKFFADGDVHKYFNPYYSPYDAFMNYMNVLADFRLRLEKLQPEAVIQEPALH
jgi:alpha-amylase